MTQTFYNPRHNESLLQCRPCIDGFDPDRLNQTHAATKSYCY